MLKRRNFDIIRFMIDILEESLLLAKAKTILSKLAEYASHYYSKYPLFSLTILFYSSLYFSTSNKTLFIFSLVYFFLIYKKTKALEKSLFFTFLATLPFAKGLFVSYLLLPKELIKQNAIFDLYYSFPISISDIFLYLLFFILIRKRKTKIAFPPLIILLFLLFFVVALVPIVYTIQPTVVVLSCIQLIRLFAVILLPKLVLSTKDKKSIIAVITSGVFFQCLWVIAQRIHNGPLGRDLEVYLPGANFGTISTENRSILRLSGTFFEPSILGTYFLTNCTAILTVILNRTSIKTVSGKFLLLTLVLSVIGIVLTGSRGIYILFICILVLFFKLYTDRIIHVIKKYKLLFIISLSGLSLALFPYLTTRLDSVNKLFAPDGSGTYRIQIAQYAVRLATQYPFGVGLNLSPYYLATSFSHEVYTFDPAHPHNVLFQILAEMGIFGLLLFCSILYLLYRYIFKLNQTVSNKNPFLFSSFVFFFCAQFYPIFLNHPEILTFFALYIGLSLI